jgi:hypothetical protein
MANQRSRYDGRNKLERGIDRGVVGSRYARETTETSDLHSHVHQARSEGCGSRDDGAISVPEIVTAPAMIVSDNKF